MKELLGELGKLRWDTLTEDEIKAEWSIFFKGGHIPDFYLHTLELILEGGRAENSDRLTRIKRVVNRK